jgi:hypothetical protein
VVTREAISVVGAEEGCSGRPYGVGMRSAANRFRALRVAWFALIVALIVVAVVVDAALAVVLAILGIGLLVLLVPPIAMYYDEHKERLPTGRSGSA